MLMFEYKWNDGTIAALWTKIIVLMFEYKWNDGAIAALWTKIICVNVWI